MNLQDRLRATCERLRRTPMAIADIIPMLQEAADTIDALESVEDELIKAERRAAKLEDESIFLNCLRNAGVDNWDGYEYAQEAYQEIMHGDE